MPDGRRVVTKLQFLHVRHGNPDFLDLPWQEPLSAWRPSCARIVDVQRGLSRHEVQFVSYGPAVYAIKELPGAVAEREYENLMKLEKLDLPAVAPVGHARLRDDDGEETGALITRFLDASLPYRTLFQGPGFERYRDRLIDAMAGLLVRLHLANVYWGDCSLSNALFRRDAGELRAYLVDAETSEIHEPLSDGLRLQDLTIMEENVDGDLADVAAEAGTPAVPDDANVAGRVRQRYDALWGEVTREMTIHTGETWRIHERVRALNALGFSVGEIEFEPEGEGRRLKLRTVVTDRDHHRHQFHNLTGLVAGEKQAEQLLNDLREFKLARSETVGRSVPMSAAAFQWRSERWEPTLAAVTPLLGRAGVPEDPAEIFCQILEHKWFLSEAAARDVGLEKAREDYLRRFAGTAGAERG